MYEWMSEWMNVPVLYIKCHVLLCEMGCFVVEEMRVNVCKRLEWYRPVSWYRFLVVELPTGLKRACSGVDDHKRSYATHPFVLIMYTRVNKNPSAWNFLSPKPEVTCCTVSIIIRVVLLSPYLRIRAVSPSSIHCNQSHRVYINRRRQYICLIWN